MRRAFPLALIAGIAFVVCSSARHIPDSAPSIAPAYEPTLYERCAAGTITSPSILRAIAIVESGEVDEAVGDGGLSLGRFQLYEVYHASRAAAWGEYDPRDPEQAGRIAALYLQDCLRAFPGDIVSGVCAYRQGVAGVKRDGPTVWYYERVMARMGDEQ